MYSHCRLSRREMELMTVLRFLYSYLQVGNGSHRLVFLLKGL